MKLGHDKVRPMAAGRLVGSAIRQARTQTQQLCSLVHSMWHKERHEREAIQLRPCAPRHACQLENRWEDVDQLSWCADHLFSPRSRPGCKPSSLNRAATDHQRHTCGRVVWHHLVVLLVLHSHVAMIRSYDENRGVLHPCLPDGLHVRPDHGIKGSHHAIVDSPHPLAPCFAVKMLSLRFRRRAALEHGGLQVTRMHSGQRRPRWRIHSGLGNLIKVRLIRVVVRVRREHALVNKERALALGSLSHERSALPRRSPIARMRRAFLLNISVLRARGGFLDPATVLGDIVRKSDGLEPSVQSNIQRVSPSAPISLPEDSNLIPPLVQNVRQLACEARRETLKVVPGPAHGQGLVALLLQVRDSVRMPPTPE
mmetsp:Transcript_10659/g.26944  ORF Transcript_10659/g.26944 Transcript_10659/m.26944 type:complete len:369 (+) Transcript_10659:547-1653(+)